MGAYIKIHLACDHWSDCRATAEGKIDVPNRDRELIDWTDIDMPEGWRRRYLGYGDGAWSVMCPEHEKET